MKKILIVDDDDRIRLFIHEALSKLGHELFEAPDGEAALEIVRREKPNLIFLDLAMPKMTGYEVCKRVRADSDPAISTAKIVIVTAKSYPVDQRMAKEVGCDLYIVKPFGIKELRDAVTQFLGAPA